MWELILLYNMNRYEAFDVGSYEQCVAAAELTYLSEEYNATIEKDGSIRILCIKKTDGNYSSR